MGAFAVVGDEVELGEECDRSTACRHHRAIAIRARQRFFPFCAVGGGAAGPEISRRADAARSGRRKRVPRILHGQPGHDKGRRRHADRQPQSADGLSARGARLPGGQPYDFRQRATLGRARDDGGSRDVGAFCPVHQFCRDRPVRLHRGAHGDDAGRAAIRQGGAAAGGAVLRGECDRARAARISARSASRRSSRLTGCCCVRN